MDISDIANLFSASENWDAALYGQSTVASNDYLGPLIFDYGNSQSQCPFISDIKHTENAQPINDGVRKSRDNSRNAGCLDGNLSHALAPLNCSAGLVSSQERFTATNVPADYFHLMNTIAPSQTSLDSEFNSDSSLSDDSALSATSSKLASRDTTDTENPLKRPCDDLSATSDEGSPRRMRCPGRRHRTEIVEPGSARAIYLEKNRHAARKCRSKQKQQQEDLIETARDKERKNKILKVEVEFLKDNMRELMEIVEKHASCPDKRLQTYVQRKADHLVARSARDVKSVAAQLPSRKASSSPDSYKQVGC